MIEHAYWEWLESSRTLDYFDVRNLWSAEERVKFNCAVYRALNTDGRLLYVGISDDFWTRLDQHRTRSPWYRFASDIFIHRCENRVEAIAKEKLSILIEKPIYNVAGTLQGIYLDMQPGHSEGCRNCGERLYEDGLFCGMCQAALAAASINTCKQCHNALNPKWSRSNQIFCDRKCKNAFWYQNNKRHHQEIYARKRQRWEQSRNGKKGGVPMREWLRLPAGWQ